MKALIIILPFIILCQESFCQTRFEELSVNELTDQYITDSPWGSGVSASDYDNDGDIDVFLCAAAPYPNLLLINQGNGKFQTQQLEKNWNAIAAIWLDYNGDRKLDLFVAGNCPYGTENCKTGSYWKLFKQIGGGSFEDVTAAAQLDQYNNQTVDDVGGLSAGDINLDGYLDIVMTYWGGAVTVFMNNGDGTFQDASNLLNTDPSEVYWQPLIYDLDQDGRAEIYLTIDYTTPNQLWKHSGDMNFKNIASEVGLNSKCEDMGLALADVENDGDLDLYITCRNFDAGEILSPLFLNTNFEFSNIAKNAGVGRSGWAWGATFLDANNDGFQDLAVTNGVINAKNERSKIWFNNGNLTFTDRSNEVGFNDYDNGSSLIALDLDRDGDLDMIQTLKPDAAKPVRFLENKLVQDNTKNYLVVQPRMSGTNYWAIGSLVKIYLGDQIQSKPITAGISYFGQEPAETFFGLGSSDKVDMIEVIWPGGARSFVEDVAANQIIQITDSKAVHPPFLKTINYEFEESLKLTWKNLCQSCSSTFIEYSTNRDFSRSDTLAVKSELSSTTINNLEAGLLYYFRLWSVLNNQKSINSNILSGTAPKAQLIAPNDLSIDKEGLNNVRLSWSDRSEFETGYEVERSLSPDFSEVFMRELGANAENMLSRFLQPGFTYYFRVRSKTNKWYSDYSDTVSISMNHILSSGRLANIKISPNPSTDYFQIDGLNGPMDITVYSLSGVKIITDWASSGNLFSHHLPTGLYILRLEDHLGHLYLEKLYVK